MSGAEGKDRDLDAYLQGDSALSRAYRDTARELPPGHLDARVLAEARQAGAGPAGPARGLFSSHWLVPASAMAVVVLAVSVVALLPEGPPAPQRPAGVDERAPAAPATAPGSEVDSDASRKEASPPARALTVPEDGAADPSRRAPTGLDRAVPPPAGRAKQAAPAESTVPRSASAPEAGAGAAMEALPDADARLARIEELVARGELGAARQALEAFRRDFPEVEVPGRIADALERAGN